MNADEFERILDVVAKQLGAEIQASTAYHAPLAFQKRVLEVMKLVAKDAGLEVDPAFHPHAFPDIRANGFGVEVKTTNKDTWMSVGNSVFEGMRDPGVEQVYVMFGKMGGMPSVRWGRYEDRITHVRISHAPRFVIEMDRDASLFEKMNLPYESFATLTPIAKMAHIREYSRNRLKPGERLWWLEDDPEPEEPRTLPIEIRLYTRLAKAEKRHLRAEAAIVCPQIVGGSRERTKYADVAMYLLTAHGVFCPQTRDLYSAGSVALRADETRGGIYVLRALLDIEDEMRAAAYSLDDAVLQEYWGYSVPPESRISEWLRRADGFASTWRPSEHIFRTP